MSRILIVDDEKNIREVVKEYAKVSGYICDEACNGLEALKKIENENYDCVILDIMMPELDGYSACKKIKEKKDVSIIMLSARQEEEDKLLSFELGVDDYVAKPFSPKELMARIKVVIERRKKFSDNKYLKDGLEVDIAGRVIKIDGETVMVTPKELSLLIYLIEYKNIAISRDKLLETIWGNDYYYVDNRTVDTHIKMLRHNLGKYAYHIVTVRAVGYKFED